MYCTTGVLLRRLQQDGFLAQVSHIVVDEVHERQVETDFLMTLLKQQAPRHPHLRLVMMSATMQEGLFADYFRCPIVYVEGRTFPVQQHYLAEVHALVAAGQREVAVERGKGRNDAHAHAHKGGGKPRLGDPGGAADGPTARPPRFDAEIIAEAVIRIIQKYGRRDRNIAVDAPPMPPQAEAALPPAEGAAAESGGDAVLVFLSGIQAIDKVGRALRQRNLASLNAYVVNLHGSLPPEQQRRVFKKTQPGTWKIVLATNIAETSVTLDDVTHVVDCGLVKELRYDPKGNMSSLQEVVISRASARQRAGRAGRVRPGHCWRLYAQEFLEGEGGMDDHPTPEIRRVPLEEVVLQVRSEPYRGPYLGLYVGLYPGLYPSLSSPYLLIPAGGSYLPWCVYPGASFYRLTILCLRRDGRCAGAAAAAGIARAVLVPVPGAAVHGADPRVRRVSP